MILALLKNRDVVLLAAVGLGLVAGDGAVYTHHLALPALAVVMTISLLGISAQQLSSPGRLLRASLWGVFLNYLVLSGVILALAHLLPLSRPLREGFIIIAAVPPAVAVIPFTDILKGDSPFTLLATAGAYLAALALMPALFMLFWGPGLVGPWQLVKVMLILVLAPLAASRVIRALGWHLPLAPWRGPLTNWCFFLVSYSIVGINAPHILAKPGTLWPVILVALGSTVILGLVIELAGRLAKVDQARLTSLVLMGTLKNYGLAGGLALALFERQTSLPAVVSVVFMFVYLIWLNLLRRSQS